MVASMVRPLRILFLFAFLLTAISNLYAQPVQIASLRPQLVWQRVSSANQKGSVQVSTTNNSLEGPVLYQLVFRFVAHDSRLAGNGSVNSPLAIASGGVNSAQLATGAVTFSKLSFGNAASGQALVADGAGGASWQTVGSGTVTSVSAAYPLLISSNPLTTPLIVLGG